MNLSYLIRDWINVRIMMNISILNENNKRVLVENKSILKTLDSIVCSSNELAYCVEFSS
jgi:hypothetical protein